MEVQAARRQSETITRFVPRMADARMAGGASKFLGWNRISG
jgi:hypothetical protein